MVIDASAATSWFLRSQATRKADVLFANPDNLDFVAPIYFGVELRNVLLSSERKGALTRAETDFSLQHAARLIRIDTGDVLIEAERAIPLARSSGLTLYDAIYLEKAMREGRRLASRDRKLLEAAVGSGVDVLDLRD